MLWLVIPHRELGNEVIRDMAVFIVLMGRRKTLISNNTEQPKTPITVYNNAINKIGQLDATGAGPVMQQKRLILQKQLINNGMG